MARLVFAGSPEFAVPSLRALLASGHQVVAVVTQPDRRAGRGRKIVAGPVKEYALQHHVPVLQPDSIGAPAALTELAALKPDAMIIVAYGQLLPSALLALPAAGCINVHASLLPRWRGAAPVQAAILAGDEQTGVCLMRMEQGLDTGPVYAAEAVAIESRETAEQLQARLAELGAHLLATRLDEILAGTLPAVGQDDAVATYASRIKKTAAVIDWTQSAVAIDRQVRAYQPWPVAETALDGERLRCWQTEPLPDGQSGEHNARPGQVMAVTSAGIDVSTGDGMLRIVELQMPGRRRMAAADFARGFDMVGRQLGN